MNNNSLKEISDEDRDSLHILPLAILPVQTPGIRRARMIKNSRLESVVELFSDDTAGSGQMDISGLPNEFAWDEGENHHDFVMLNKLSELPSFDVYSLRIQLRKLDIDVENVESLRLSPTMNKRLTNYMTEFTHPLILHIYGAEAGIKVNNFEDVIALFQTPDVKKALERLRMMASKLGIRPEDVPAFLEDYGDVFLSLSYFRRCFDSIEPIINQFMLTLDDIRGNYQIRHDPALMHTFNEIEQTLSGLMSNITGRFEVFDRSSKNMWSEISATRFRKVEQMVKGNHVTIGGMICALSCKMSAWARMFPSRGMGGPQKRAEFIHSELRQGIDRMQMIERESPRIEAIV
ncbi:MAG: hypothetical protein ACYYKD_00360 [Rhodospirillales bacterium]